MAKKKKEKDKIKTDILNVSLSVVITTRKEYPYLPQRKLQPSARKTAFFFLEY